MPGDEDRLIALAVAFLVESGLAAHEWYGQVADLQKLVEARSYRVGAGHGRKVVSCEFVLLHRPRAGRVSVLFEPAVGIWNHLTMERIVHGVDLRRGCVKVPGRARGEGLRIGDGGSVRHRRTGNTGHDDYARGKRYP